MNVIVDPWLPIGFVLPDGACGLRVLFAGSDWQIIGVRGGARALVARAPLVERWVNAGLLASSAAAVFHFGGEALYRLPSGTDQQLAPLPAGESPQSYAEARAFALALRATRDLDPDTPLQDAVYV